MKPNNSLLLALALSVLYGTLISWRYHQAKVQLSVYQNGALAMIGSKIEETDTTGQDQRMAQIGLLDALNDTPNGAQRRSKLLLPLGQE